MTLRQDLIRSLANEGNHLRVVRTLPQVLRELSEVAPLVWGHREAEWRAMSDEARVAAMDRKDDLQAEARAMIEAATGCSWESISEACL